MEATVRNQSSLKPDMPGKVEQADLFTVSGIYNCCSSLWVNKNIFMV